VNHKHSDSFESDCEAALGWIARLRSDTASDEDRQSFALWLAEDAGHGQAMDSMLDLWDDLGAVRHLPGLDETATNNPRYWPLAAAALAACLVVALLLWPQFQGSPAAALYQTAMGEQRDVLLEDGSQLTLNTNTRVHVASADDQRLVELLRGEAYFRVTPDEKRPFHVDTGNTRITVLGTAFNVYRQDDRTEVTVTEGVVRVTEKGETGSRAPDIEVLHDNQQLTATGRGLQAVTVIDADRRIAWQRGELVAEEMPLPELIRQLQRYHSTRVVIADAELATLTVSGVFRLDQPESILQALEITLGIEADRMDDGSIRLLASGP
jgi:transmembrane sensor